MKIAITGGIGSGKTFVCQCLKRHGIEVYDCDAAAKRLMHSSAELKRQLQDLVGKEVYQNGILQKALLAEYLLSSDIHSQAVSDIVHPAVASDFVQSGTDWLESAIFFDSGFNRRIYIDKVVCVSAPTDVRIGRITARDHITPTQAMAWIARQLPQEELIRRSDYEMINDGQHDIDAQVIHLLRELQYKK